MSTERKDNITIVSGYWPVSNKYTPETYYKWFANTMQINQRMYFFCDPSIKDTIIPYRKGLETIFVDHPLNNFFSINYYRKFVSDPFNKLSKERSKILHEKIDLMKVAKDMDGENATDFYIWYDAGAFIYRNQPPPSIRLNLKDVNSLPRNKVCYSEPFPSSDDYSYASTIHIIHKDLIDQIHTLYYKYVKICITKYRDWRSGSDEVVFTEMLKDYPYLFYKISTGYGENIRQLYKFV
jgi:hypothetical protein